MQIFQKNNFYLVWGNTEKKVKFYYVGIKEMKICVQEGCERYMYSWMQYMKYQT